MKKEYGWIDYTNLALNVTQTLQLEAVRTQLAQLQQVDLDERTRAEVLNKIRQWVFDMEQGYKTLLQMADLEKEISSSEQKEKLWMSMYMLGSALNDNFAVTGISPATFPEFNDKDRVQKIISDFEHTITETYQKLGEASRSEVDACRRFIKEEPQLDELITFLKAIEESKVNPLTAKDEMARLKKELDDKKALENEVRNSTKETILNAEKNLFKKTNYALIPVWLILWIGSFFKYIDDESTTTDYFFVILGIPFFLLSFHVSIMLCSYYIYKFIKFIKGNEINEKAAVKSHPQINLAALRGQISSLNSRFNLLQSAVAEIDRFNSLFGNLSEKEAIALKSERALRIEKIYKLSLN